jgi:predicted DNA-binding transcriptional regulator AlpA
VARVLLSTKSALWSVPQFAEWAGMSVPAAYRQIGLGRVPGVVRFGKTIRIDPEQVHEWLQSDQPTEAVAQ